MPEITISLPDGTISCQAILFDMDGVLVDSLGLIERHLRDWAHRHALDADHVFATSHGRTNEDLVRVVAPHLDPQAEAARLIEKDIHDVDGIAARDGAPELLKRLPAGRWAVVTSAYRPVAHARLAQAGLCLPTVLITANDITAGKPAPDGYDAAAGLLGTPPTECVVIEDAPSGVTAARAAGARVIGITGTTDHDDLDADFVITSLKDVQLLP